MEISYVLEARSTGWDSRPPASRWHFSRHLGTDATEARIELARVRSLAAGADLHVQYQVRKRTEEVLSW